MKFEPEIGTKYNKETMLIEKEIESENKEAKGKIAKVTENGWEAEGKVIHKAKVILFK